MHKINFRLSTVLVLLLYASWLLGQTEVMLDQIHLRSGKTIIGVITEYKAGAYIVVQKASNNRSSRYPMEAVARITQTTGELTEDIQLPYLIKSDITTTVELKDGSRYKGEMKSYDPETGLQLEVSNGTNLTIEEEEIERVFYDIPRKLESVLASEEDIEEIMRKGVAKERPAPRPKPPYEFSERGVFNATSFSFSFGSRERSNQIIDPFFPEPRSTTRSTIGFNVQHITGFQFSRKL
ncbi:MAG: hypothetical protein AAGJ93_17520, partial [Bacteroidota bacterium]